ncbi:Uncharacterised protein [Enterococcus hirae]|uniref:hypothetical protein n=1 Tax=Enterococcus hirae TaxID=1354 RepID=UPI0010EE4F47|nr:hypothetical protein [Enterococcus hirae]VTS76219.1 Uncharacterised protein [Enterococcus hirae]
MIIEFLETNGLELQLNQKMDLDKGFVQLKRQNEECLPDQKLAGVVLPSMQKVKKYLPMKGNLIYPFKTFI